MVMNGVTQPSGVRDCSIIRAQIRHRLKGEELKLSSYAKFTPLERVKYSPVCSCFIQFFLYRYIKVVTELVLSKLSR